MSSGDLQQRFQTSLEAHKGILYKVSNAYCRNRDDREDLAQEIAVQLWRAFPAFDARCAFSTWMYRIALNVAISFYRRESTRARYVQPREERLVEAIDLAAGQSDELAQLHQFLERLDPLNRALALLYLDGNSYREIADVLGITETNVATKINRLKKRGNQ